MPCWAVIDPSWMLSLPAQQIAFNGLDAITQLIEGYTSSKANDFTDGLALGRFWKGAGGFTRVGLTILKMGC